MPFQKKDVWTIFAWFNICSIEYQTESAQNFKVLRWTGWRIIVFNVHLNAANRLSPSNKDQVLYKEKTYVLFTKQVHHNVSFKYVGDKQT